jgi:hypothetical protein
MTRLWPWRSRRAAARHLADVRLIAFWQALGADVRAERVRGEQ